MLHKQQQTISIRSNVREWTHVLLANTPRSHLHSFCATGVSSGLATRVTLTRVSRGRLGEFITWGWTCFWCHFCTAVRDCYWVVFQMVHSVLFILRGTGSVTTVLHNCSAYLEGRILKGRELISAETRQVWTPLLGIQTADKREWYMRPLYSLCTLVQEKKRGALTCGQKPKHSSSN
jgi:hypothetical protein